MAWSDTREHTGNRPRKRIEADHAEADRETVSRPQTSLASAAALITGARIVQTAVIFVLAMMLSRGLTKPEYGLYQHAQMLASVIPLMLSVPLGKTVTYFLPRIARLPMALNMITTGRIVEADECYKEGLIDELVEEGEALTAAMEYAKKLARGPSVAIDLARHFIYKSLDSNLDEMIDYEGVAAVMSAMTEDAREATASFLEKRRPVYKGR